MEGRVEICDSYSRWGTVCNRQWTSSHTRVVCHNLGYDDTEGKFPIKLLSMILVLKNIHTYINTMALSGLSVY